MTELRPAFFTAPYYPAEKSHNSVIGGWEVSLAHSLTDLLHTPPNPLLSPAVRFIQIKMSSSFLTWFNTFFPPPEEGLGLPQVVKKVLKSKWVGESPYFLIDFVLWNLPLPSFFLIFFLNHGNSDYEQFVLQGSCLRFPAKLPMSCMQVVAFVSILMEGCSHIRSLSTDLK